MSAEYLRETAEGATQEAGATWHTALALPGYAWLEPAHIGLHGYSDTARHIAKWHPGVALAVAALLDIWADHNLLTSSGSLADEKAAILAVARAWRGDA